MALQVIKGDRDTKRVRIGGVPLDIRPSHKAMILSATFNWGVITMATHQLALAILMRYTNKEHAIAKHQSFANQHLREVDLVLYLDVEGWLASTAPRPE